MADAPEVMNIRQASEYLGVSPDTLYKYVYEEKIPAFKLGNRWKFKKTILDSWMERKSTVGEGKAKKSPRRLAPSLVGRGETLCLEWVDRKRLSDWTSVPAASRLWN